MSVSLFDKYGGFPTIGKLVFEFYKKVLADSSLAGFFKDTSMDKLMEHQTSFLSMVLGGPNQYAGRELKPSHEKLNISDSAFIAVSGYLEETLEEAGVEDDDIVEIMKIVSTTRPAIVSNKAS